jgi:hypothetical protein
MPEVFLWEPTLEIAQMPDSVARPPFGLDATCRAQEAYSLLCLLVAARRLMTLSGEGSLTMSSPQPTLLGPLAGLLFPTLSISHNQHNEL